MVNGDDTLNWTRAGYSCGHDCMADGHPNTSLMRLPAVVDAVARQLRKLQKLFARIANRVFSSRDANFKVPSCGMVGK